MAYFGDKYEWPRFKSTDLGYPNSIFQHGNSVRMFLYWKKEIHRSRHFSNPQVVTSGRQFAPKHGSLYRRFCMLSDGPVSWGKLEAGLHILKDLPNSLKDIRSYKEEGNNWLFWPKITQDNLTLTLHLFSVLESTSLNTLVNMAVAPSCGSQVYALNHPPREQQLCGYCVTELGCLVGQVY